MHKTVVKDFKRNLLDEVKQELAAGAAGEGRTFPALAESTKDNIKSSFVAAHDIERILFYQLPGNCFFL